MIDSIHPLYDYILVSLVNDIEEKTTDSGIIIPDGSKNTMRYAYVHATGCGKLLDDGTVKKLIIEPGDKILLNKYGGIEIDKNLWLFKESEVLAIVK